MSAPPDALANANQEVSLSPMPTNRQAAASVAETDVRDCYQCGKCSAGCPVAEQMDLLPHQLMRLVQIGRIDRALRSEAIWKCVSCMTCSTRCPKSVDCAGVIDTLRQSAVERGDGVRRAAAHRRVSAGVPRQHPPQRPALRVGIDRRVQNQGVLQGQRHFPVVQGRDVGPAAYEAQEVPPSRRARSRPRRRAADFREMRVPLAASQTCEMSRARLQQLRCRRLDFVDIGYYPGCALHGSSNDYGSSVRACLAALGVELRELDDWICCGATAAHSLNHLLAIALPARNLAIAERDGLPDLLAPCPMCSMELMKAGSALAASADLRRQISDIVELEVTGGTRVLNLIQILQKMGLEKIKAKAVRPLADFHPACYYGCLLTRPPKTLQFDDCEQPSSMETILRALGASPVEWNMKTECCGAGMTMADEDVVLDLVPQNTRQCAASTGPIAWWSRAPCAT